MPKYTATCCQAQKSSVGSRSGVDGSRSSTSKAERDGASLGVESLEAGVSLVEGKRERERRIKLWE